MTISGAPGDAWRNTDARASYSQFGNTLELSAPGGSAGRCAPPVTPFIVSTGLILSGQTPLFAYLCLIGTSFSAPHVSGVAGLVKDANPSATNEEIRLHLQQTSEDLGSDGYDIQFGFGLVRADSALSISINLAAPSIPTITTPSDTTNITPTTIDGTGDIGSIIELFNGASSLGNQTANGSGDWQFTNVVLAEGDNSFTATASDGVNTSDPSPATVITLDTITNDDVPPFLKLVKAVTNDDGGIAQPNDWRLNATANVTTSSNFNNLGGSGNFTAILANNTYTLSEENGPGNYTASSWSCDVGVVTGTDKIQVPLGVNATCTITNDDVAPPSCVPPEFGDWTITSSCSLENSFLSPSNVIVQNNSLLTIPSGITLTIPSGSNITIESGGAILIKSTGSLKVGT